MAFALLCTEWLATRSLDAVLGLGFFFLAFVLFVPALSRETPKGRAWVLLYVVLCFCLTGAVCFVAPYWLGYESYVAHPPAAVAIAVLVAMAGWVLSRDIDLSEGLAAEQVRARTLRLEAEDARLVALRTQLDPHFLFNTLGAIAEWCREDPLVAERALLQLSSMLRSLFEGVQEAWWPLERELALLRALQELYAVRDEERYKVLFAVDDVHGVSVPPLLFLPLLENALNHGSGEGAMRFELAVLENVLELELWNPGEFNGPREGGTGIDTTRRRLTLAYGGKASLDVHSETLGEVHGTKATLRIPALPQVDSIP